MIKILVISLITLIVGCSTYTQTTSGTDYLARHQVHPSSTDSTIGDGNVEFEEMLRNAAAVEPHLRFPARIGIVRLQSQYYRRGGELMEMADGEVAAWQNLATRLGPSFGEFIPVQPLVIDLMRGAASGQSTDIVETPVDAVRLAAARQHLDAVLIYEIGTELDQNSNVLSLGVLTLIGGYLLPSERLDAKAAASAMLIDVMEGYPYGTANTVVNESDMATAWGSDDTRRNLEERAGVLATEKLALDIETMFKDLRYKLAEQREVKPAL
jgi:hypothetical protein